MARTAFEEAVLSGVNLHAGAKFSDGTFPHNFWSSPNGNDGTGNGSQYAPYLTLRRAIRQTIDNRGDRVIFAGSFAETIDIGSGSTNGGNTNGGYAKRALQLLGDDTVYNGRNQIVGDGATTTATLRVRSGYLGGFVLKNVEMDVTTVTQPAIHLVTSDTGASPAASDANYRALLENVAVRSDNPTVGLLLEGTTLCDFRKLWIQGPTIGIGFTGSANNSPSDLDFEDLDFRDCVTADMATLANSASTTIAAVGLTNVSFLRPRHWDRGGTPVTNYVNFSTGTMVNVHGTGCFWARDVADDTLLAIPANVVFTGDSAAAAEFIIGA